METNSTTIFIFFSSVRSVIFPTEAYVLCYCYCIMGEIFYSLKRAKSWHYEYSLHTFIGVSIRLPQHIPYVRSQHELINMY